MSKRKVGTPIMAGTFDLARIMARAVAGIATVLGTATWGALFHVTERGHFTKRSALTAAIRKGGTLADVRTTARTLAIAPMRAEVQYAHATGDFAYFRARDGKAWAPWASPLIDGDTLRASPTDEQCADAYERAIPLNASNVAGMCATISLTARKRNVAPVPVFTDARKTGTVETFDAAKHGADAYAREAYGGAEFTI